jgi:indoleamine 2,3-dioxygenase
MSQSFAETTISHDRGFLPLQDPLTLLPKVFNGWEEVAHQLPKLLVSNQIHRTIGDLPPFPLEEIHDSRELERAMVLLSYLGHAYVWGGPRPETVLPARLAVPWYDVAGKLGRPPVLSYSSYSLHNFFRFDSLREPECGNIGLIQNFLGGLDEEWFILIHVDIERKAGPAMALLHGCLDSAEAGQAEELEVHLAQVEASLRSMYATMLRTPEHCDPYIYYHRVRPYIHGWRNHPDLPDGLIYEGVTAFGGRPQQFRGETGAQSSIVPSLDAMLGVAHQQDALSLYLQEMRAYMPPAHRAFIESLEVRTSVRGFVQGCRRPSLTSVYNACTEAVENFRSLHLEYAAKYIFHQAQIDPKNPHTVGTGGTPFMRYLKKHRDETGQSRLGANDTRKKL